MTVNEINNKTRHQKFKLGKQSIILLIIDSTQQYYPKSSCIYIDTLIYDYFSGSTVLNNSTDVDDGPHRQYPTVLPEK